MTWMDYVWFAWVIAFGLLEAFGVTEEGKVKGAEPLTRLVRDKLMRRHWPLWVAALVFWAWMLVHFFLQ